LTPAYAAIVTRCGGLRAVVRFNMIAGLLSLLAFSTLLLANRCRGSHVLLSVFLLAAQPIWLYHLQFPVSEMMQLCLVCYVGALLPLRKSGLPVVVLLGLALFAGVVNRLSFLPFASLLLLVTAWLDVERTERRRVVTEHSVVWLGLAAGTVYDLACSPVTVACLRPVLPALFIVAGGCLMLTVALDALAARASCRARLTVGSRWLPWLAVGGAVACCAVLHLYKGEMLRAGLSNARGVVPFIGWAAMAAAWTGLALLLLVRDAACRHFRGFILFLLGASAVVFLHQHIAGIYPYATRRYLAYTIPAVAIGGGGLAAWLWDRRGRVRALARLAAAVCLAAVVMETAKVSWHAWSRTEYDGLSAVLVRVAGQIRDDDVVVADHPWWGMPLRFIYGRPVLNGKSFYSRQGTSTMEHGLVALGRLRREGRRVRFLTSTSAGMDVFPMVVDPVRLDWASGELHLDTIMHGRRASDFRVRRKRKEFRLYTWVE